MATMQQDTETLAVVETPSKNENDRPTLPVLMSDKSMSNRSQGASPASTESSNHGNNPAVAIPGRNSMSKATMATIDSQSSIARPVVGSAKKTYVTCAPVPSYSATIMNESQSRQPQKAHAISSSLTVTALNATNRPPPLARHSRPAGASPRCQDAPLDLTKPLDLSVNKKRPRSAERTHEDNANKCYRHIPSYSLVGKSSNPAVVTPFNFATMHNTHVVTRTEEHTHNASSRRTGLIGSSPRNYNHRGKAVVAPRRDPEPGHGQYQEHQRQLAELQREASKVKHGNVPVSSVPYSNLAHPFSKSSSFTGANSLYAKSCSFTGTSSSLSFSRQLIPPARQSTSSSPYRSVHGHGQMVASAEDRDAVLENHTNSVVEHLPDKHVSPARVAHVTAFSRTSTSVAPITAPSHTQSHASASFGVSSMKYSVGMLSGNPSSQTLQSSQHMFTGNMSNGTSSMQNKKMRRSHSVSPMRFSRHTYGKGNNRHNVRVLRMLDSTIAAGAKITKFLPPIDGPEAPRMLSSRSELYKEDNNNNSSRTPGTYTQPLRVDIPEHLSPSVPPTLSLAFEEERMVPSAAEVVESTPFRTSGSLNQLSPPSSGVAHDRISPTMPVLVPHSMYSPMELPRPDAADSAGLPVLKKAKLDMNCATQQSLQYNPLTYAFMSVSSASESKKVQSVPPIVSQQRRVGDARFSRQSLQRPPVQHSSREQRHFQLAHANTRETNSPTQKDLEHLLMQLGRRQPTPCITVQRDTCSSASTPVSSPPMTNRMASTPVPTVSHSKYEHPFVERSLRTLEKDREIMRRLLYNSTRENTNFSEISEGQTLITSDIQKQEPEVVDLTSSPSASPSELKSEQPIEQHEQTSWEKDHTPSKPLLMKPSKCEETVNSLFRFLLSRSLEAAARKPLTMKETIELALESSFLEDERNTKQVESKSDSAKPLSSVLSCKSETGSKESTVGKEDPHSFCRKHRRLLFPFETPKCEVAKSEACDKTRWCLQSPTISEVITHVVESHDPRKKHLARLKRKDNVSPTQSLPTEEAVGELPTTTSHQGSASAPVLPSLSSTEQRRRRKLNMEISRIANTASYVGDLPKKPRSGDLLVDSSLLDREERALQRAMLRFSEMEQQARIDLSNNATNQEPPTKPNVEQKKRRPIRGRPPRGRGRGLNRTAKLVKVGRRRRFPWRLGRPQAARRVSPRKRKLNISNQSTCTSSSTCKEPRHHATKTTHTFLDFKPEILDSRTRNESNTDLDVTDRSISSVEKITVEETPLEPVLPKYGERGRNSVRKRLPYHKNARYEREIEKEEAKLVERKRKRTVSYSSGADTTDDSPVVPQPPPPPPPPLPPPPPPAPAPPAVQVVVKRKRGRPKKSEAEKTLAARKRNLKVKYKGVSRGRYPRIKKKTSAKKTTNVSKEEDNANDNAVFVKNDLQRPLQVVMDPDNHTKIKFVSLKGNAQVDDTNVVKVKREPVKGKRKKKTKNLGPVSPSRRENADNGLSANCDEVSDPKVKIEIDSDITLGIQQIKEEPHDPGYELETKLVIPPPPQIVRPDPPADLKKLICNKKLGETVLHRACRMARDDVAIYCIDYQMCDINAKDNAGYTPLHECCVNGRLQVAEHLLRHGADMNVSAADGTRPIHDAVDNHHMDIVRLLLAFGADPLEVTYSGRTALKLARNHEMRSFLVGYLRDVNGEWEIDEEEYPEFVGAFKDTDWKFRSSVDISTDRKSDIEEVGVFADVTEDNSPEVDSIDDILFEMSDTPHLQTYNLQLARDNGPRNWLLVDDVRRALGGKYDDIINTCEDVEPITISRREFNYALKEGLASLPTDLPPKVHGHVSDSEAVELVELNDRIRQALNIDTEFVR